ncbi:MAG: 4Fe-4S dicluster domain-containing protein [Anaerolineaceae bacterium]|nr:4Fe-4S dicluster domain-containing protein [Anaerolineaceae bacterium]
MPLSRLFILIADLIFIAGFLTFAIVSMVEGQRRAARLSAMLAALSGLALSSLLLTPPLVTRIAALTLAILLGLFILWLAWPVKRQIATSPMPSQRVDERTIMFARARLEPGTPQFEAYYREHPEHLAPDNAFRANQGLLQPGSAFYDAFLSASPDASFFLTGVLRDQVNGPVAPEKVEKSPEVLTRFVKGLAAYHGAVDSGICELQPYHIYSHIGRGTGEYGAPITLNHRFAIAFTVEMDHAMISAAPRMPAVMESAREYVEAAKIAVILAAAIRSLGYPALAHIDSNYRVIAPLVAKDAGLGEIGRMGLLMTPRLGPRVRLAVVTTDLPLVIDQPTFDPTVIDFCNHCQKCVEVCPSNAIPAGERTVYPDDTLRWKINSEQCFTYWTQIGTDCGRCMAVCPYAHPDTALHNLIRLGVTQSANFRRAAVTMDDLFYGRKPKPHVAPKWLQFK